VIIRFSDKISTIQEGTLLMYYFVGRSNCCTTGVDFTLVANRIATYVLFFVFFLLVASYNN